MMRTFFWILLLANALFFAAMQWGGLSGGDQGPQAQLPLHEEKIRLADMPHSAPVAALPVSAPASAPVAASSAPVATSGAVPAPVKVAAQSCMEWGEFSGAELKRATAALGALHLGDKLSQRHVEQIIGYWVYIPPLKDKAAVVQKVAQLKARGVEEYFVVPDAGPWLNAISLGVFKTQEAAESFLESLRAKDVRTAKVGERAGKLKATIFVLNGLDDAVAERLAAMQKDFSGSELKKISCPH